jgi:hypothetical protein
MIQDNLWRPADWFNEYEGAYLEPEIAKIKELCFEAGASAMLAVRDKDWIAWGESKCTSINHSLSPHLLKRDCLICWIERKKDLGL